MVQRTQPLWSISSRFIINGAKLTRARVDANLSMLDVATALGCNKSSVSRWEQGTLTPSEERIFKLAELLGSWEFVTGNPNHGKDTRRKSNGRENYQPEKLEGSDEHSSTTAL